MIRKKNNNANNMNTFNTIKRMLYQLNFRRFIFRRFLLYMTISMVVLPCSTINAVENRVQSGEFVQTKVLTGSLVAQKAERFVVPVTNEWRIQIKWMVKEGEYVKPGSAVVRFDPADLLSKIDDFETALKQAKEEKKQKLATLEHERFELDVSLKKAETDYKKTAIDASVPKSVQADYEYDKKQLDMEKSAKTLEAAKIEKKVKTATLKADLKTLELEIEKQKANLEKNKKTVSSLVLKAKTEGTVIYGEHAWEERKIQVGDTVSATWTIATIPNINTLQAEAWINETEVNKVEPGQKVNVILDAYPHKMVKGTIRDVSNNAEKRKKWGKTHYFKVTIALDNLDTTIMKPGMSVKCIVETTRLDKTLLVPLEMVHFDGSNYKIKPKGKEAVSVTPAGMNAFYMALAKAPEDVGVDTLLEPVNPKELEESSNENE